MKTIRKILCFLGFHRKEEVNLGFWFEPDVMTGKRPDVYYKVCPHCKRGHPFLTGHW
jgi:elongation factor P hydroxylase